MSKIVPSDSTTFNHRFVDLPSGRRYHTVDQPPTSGAKDGPVVLMCHGFPDLWYGWRYQIAAFADLGWRCIVPSQLGYHGTDKPVDPAEYTFKNVAHDMDALLKAIGIDGKVVVCGHDWGGMVAWRFVDYFPDRVIAVACVSTPYMPPANPAALRPTTEQVLAKLPSFGYQFYFSSPEAPFELAEAADLFLAGSLSPAYRRQVKAKGPQPGGGEWVKFGELQKKIHGLIVKKRAGEAKNPAPEDHEFEYYLTAFGKNGFAAPLNWYKTRYLNFYQEQEDSLGPFPSHIPALQIPTLQDAALTKEMCYADSVLGAFPGGNLEVKPVDVDHWALQDEDKRGEVTGLLQEFIQRVLEGKWEAKGKVAKM